MRKAILVIPLMLSTLFCWAQLAGIDRNGFTSGAVVHKRLNGALGEVFVLGIYKCGTGIQSGIIVDSSTCPPVGIDYSKEIHVLALYPNPSSNWLEINLPVELKGKGSVSIRNVHGGEVVRADIKYSTKRKRIDVSRLTPGVYLISINDKRKRHFETARFVKI